jgi:hypothetical protein
MGLSGSYSVSKPCGTAALAVAPPQWNTGASSPVPQVAIDNKFVRLDEGLQALDKRRPGGPDG